MKINEGITVMKYKAALLFLFVFRCFFVSGQTCTDNNLDGMTILNPNGGTNAANGLRIILSGAGNMQIRYLGENQIFSPSWDWSFSGSRNSGTSNSHGINLAIGNTRFTSGMIAFTSSYLTLIEKKCGSRNGGATQFFQARQSAVVAGRTYYLTTTYEYTIPNLYLTITHEVEIPEGNTLPVKLAHGWDTYLSGGDSGPGFIRGNSPYFMVGVQKSNVYQAFRYREGVPWSGYYSAYFTGVSNNLKRSGDDFMVYADSINTNPTTDNGIGISINFGSTPGTYRTVNDVVFKCNAPSARPGFSQSTVQMICGRESVNLRALFNGTIRQVDENKDGINDIVLRFLDAAGNIVADATQISASGVYYAEFYDTFYGCNSDRTELRVIAANCVSDVELIDMGRSTDCAYKNGGEFVQRYKVVNRGPNPTSNINVSLAELDPASIEYVDAVLSVGDYDYADNVWTIPLLDNAGEATIAIRYRFLADPANVYFISDASAASGSSKDSQLSNNTVPMTGKYVFALDRINTKDDSLSVYKGEYGQINVLANDILNGVNPVVLNTHSGTRVYISSSTSDEIRMDDQGNVSIPSTLKEGEYRIIYTLCYYSEYGHAIPSCTNCVNGSLIVNVGTKICYMEPNLSKDISGDIPGIGVSLLKSSDGVYEQDWLNKYKGAHIAMESHRKGFVISRLTTAQINNIPASNLLKGMMVYDTDRRKLLIYVITPKERGWKSFTKQSCPQD